MTMELSGLNVDYASLAVEMQEKMANESDILSVGFPDQTVVLLSNTLAGGLAMLNYSQLTANLNNFLPFAFLKSAGYAISATLGVAPRRKTASSMQGRLRPPGQLGDFTRQMDAAITIPAYSRFRCRNQIWHTRQSYTLRPFDTFVDIALYEGEVVVEEFRGLGERYQRWYIGTQFNVDNNTVRVMIDDDWWDEGEASFVYYTPADQVFLQQTSPDGKVLVFFGNGIYGRVPSRDSTIRIYYTITNGFVGNSSSIGDNIDLLDRIVIGPGQTLLVDGITLTPAVGGEDEHTLEDIKYVTPRLYAANRRAVRRDDYIGHMLGNRVPLVFADARVWGEYEQALKEGVQKLEMMNRAYWTGILRTFAQTKHEQIDVAQAGGQANFAFVLPESVRSVLPGSVQVTNNNDNTVFADMEGNGVLVSQDIVFNSLTGGTARAQNVSGGSDVSRLNDPSIDSYWQSLSSPDLGNPVRVSYTWATARVPKSFRFRASNQSSREERAFPRSVSFYGSNKVTLPSIESDEDWTAIRGRVFQMDPGVASFAPWVTLDNKVAYKHIMVKIEDRHGNAGWTRISEWQVQVETDSSLINYETLSVTVKYPALHPPGIGLTVSHYGPDLDDTQQLEIFNFLHGGAGHKALNHFTTDITYKSPIMKRIEIEVEVYYLSEYDENVVQNNVERAIQRLFQLKMGSIGRKVTNADLMRAVIALKEVDYAVFLNPGFGSDILVGLGEFIHLDNIRVNMYVTERVSA